MQAPRGMVSVTTALRVGLVVLAFGVGFVFSDVDRAARAVTIGAAAGGAVVGVVAGAAHLPRATASCLHAAVGYFGGLFISAAVHDKLSLLPFAVAFMAVFTAIFLTTALLGRFAGGFARRE